MGAVFVILMSLFGTATGWYRPFYGLMVYYAFAILRPEMLWFYHFQGGNRFSFFIAISTLIGWMIKGGPLELLKIPGIKFPLFAYSVYMAMGYISAFGWAQDRAVALAEMEVLMKAYVMFLVTMTVVRTPQQIRFFGYMIVACLGYLGWHYNYFWYFPDYGIDRNLFRSESYGWLHGDNNGTALVILTGVPMAFFLMIYLKPMWQKAACAFALALMMHSVLFSESRGAMLSMCVVAFLVFAVAMFTLPRKMLILAAGVVFSLLALRLAGEAVRARFMMIFADDLDRSASDRILLWKAAWTQMKLTPMGLGPRNFPLIMERYDFQRGKVVHNLYLQVGADFGFIGLGGMLAFHIWTGLVCLKATVSSVARRLVWPRFYTMMVCISGAGFMTGAQFLSTERMEVPFIIMQLGLCTVAYLHRVSQADVDRVPELEQVPEEHGGYLSTGGLVPA